MSVILFKRKSLLDKMLSAVKAVGGAAWYVPDDFLVLGPELSPNPGSPFSDTSGITTFTSGVLSVINGMLRSGTTAGASQPMIANFAISTTIGKTYKISVPRATKTTNVGGLFALQASVNANGSSPFASISFGAAGAGSYGQMEYVFTATTTTTYVGLRADNGVSGTSSDYSEWGGCSVREVLSAKDFQYTSGETPSYLGGSVGLMYDALAQLGADKNTLPYSGWSKPTGVTTDGDSLILADFSTSLSTYGMIGIEQGKSYRISYTISEYVSGNIKAICSTSVSGAVRSTNGTYTEILVPSSTGGNFGFQPSTLNFTGKIRVNYVREVTGTMVSQATAANKPTITRIPRKLGPELVVNGDFSSGASSWGTNGSTVNTSAGDCAVTVSTTTGRIEQSVSWKIQAGKTYYVTADIKSGSDISSRINIIRSAIGGYAAIAVAPIVSAATNAVNSVVFTAPADDAIVQVVNASGLTSGTFICDNISVREVLEWSYALSFDGTNDSLAAPASVIGSNLSQPYTMIAWGKIGATGIARTMSGDGLRGVGISSLGRARAIHNGPGVKDGSTTLVQGQSVVIESTWDGATTSVYLNGSLEVSSAFSAPSGAVSPTAIGQFGAASSYWNESIGGCVVCPAVMTEAQRKAVRNFAAFELGLTLP